MKRIRPKRRLCAWCERLMSVGRYGRIRQTCSDRCRKARLRAQEKVSP